MILGALVALGVDENKLIEQIKLLDAADFELEFKTVDKSGIAAVHAVVKVPREHAHRHLSTIEKIIYDSQISDKIKRRAMEIFTRLAEAEAKVHGIPIEKVHFHEVGAMDAIIDVVGACVGFEILGVEKFICSRIHVGSGFARMAHGTFPVPPPAVAELLKDVPIYSTEIEGELITPTGAAIISTVCDSYGAIPEMRFERIAYGAGTREYQDFPNVLRLMIGEVQSSNFKVQSDLQADNRQLITDNLLLIETNIDDLSPEILGFVMEKAFQIGALDCWFTAIQMKKNRPATKLSVLCKPVEKEKFLELVFKETTTLGVRVSEVERNCLPREIIRVETEFGAIDVKVAKLGEKIMNAKPEFEQVKEIAERAGISVRRIVEEIERSLSQ